MHRGPEMPCAVVAQAPVPFRKESVRSDERDSVVWSQVLTAAGKRENPRLACLGRCMNLSAMALDLVACAVHKSAGNGRSRYSSAEAGNDWDPGLTPESVTMAVSRERSKRATTPTVTRRDQKPAGRIRHLMPR
ncbi:hypothetical protein CPLU01_05517 [Colletotrichum plurivorum]|uniref:Uncharacterized protein n=1 Tax=Colletotrichum plurivorum TaxID=2175906 RepID=A0A8H6NHD4_9PEZI|nr:hypothetical protein CPLU01_05517 [Colletotrichum plurivorum]